MMGDDLQLFAPMPGEDDLEKKFYVDYRSTTQWQHGAPLEFHVSSAVPYLISLKDTTLHLTWSCTADDAEVRNNTTDVGAPINLTHQTMWKEVNISLQHHPIHSVGNLYPYRAYIETILGGHSIPGTELWYPDAPHAFNSGWTDVLIAAARTAHATANKDKSEAPPFVPGEKNDGFVKRLEFIVNGKQVETIGPIHHDLCQQSKPLLPQTDMVVQFWPSDDSFTFMSRVSNKKFKIKIHKAVLRVGFLKLKPKAIKDLESTLSKKNAVYPLKRVIMKNYTIPSTASSFTVEDLYHGSVPSILIAGLVETRAFTGDLQKNPMEFKNYDVKSVGFFVNGESVPQAPLEMTFSSGEDAVYVNGYNSLLRAAGGSLSFNMKDWAAGSALYAFDVAGRDEKHAKRGQTRLDITMGGTNTDSKTLITYAIFPGSLEITKDRQILEK